MTVEQAVTKWAPIFSRWVLIGGGLVLALLLLLLSIAIARAGRAVQGIRQANRERGGLDS